MCSVSSLSSLFAVHALGCAFISHVDFDAFHLCPGTGHDRGSRQAPVRFPQLPKLHKRGERVALCFCIIALRSLTSSFWKLSGSGKRKRNIPPPQPPPPMHLGVNICTPKSSYWPKERLQLQPSSEGFPWSVSSWPSESAFALLLQLQLSSCDRTGTHRQRFRDQPWGCWRSSWSPSSSSDRQVGNDRPDVLAAPSFQVQPTAAPAHPCPCLLPDTH